MQIHILIIVIAVITAAAKAALSFVRKTDEKNGLKMNDGSYSAGGIIKLLFKKEDKRVELEKKPELKAVIDSDPEVKKRFLIGCGVSAALLAVCAVVSFLYGYAPLPSVIGAVLMLLYMWRRTDRILYFSIFVAILIFGTGIVFLQLMYILPVLCHIPAVVIRRRILKSMQDL